MSSKPVTPQIDTVVEIAAQKRDEAMRALGRVQNELEQARQQMTQLQDYAVESQTRWNHRATEGVSAALMQHQRQFMARLDHAVAFQRDVIVGIERSLEQLRVEVTAAERELASLNKYVERRVRAWQQEQQRHEQKATDETAANTHRRQQTQNPWSRNP